MTNKKRLLAIAAVAGMATTAQAQGISFDGAYVQGENISNIYAGVFDYSQSGIYGAAQASVGRFAVQVDVGIFGYDNQVWDNYYYNVHAMYEISPNLVAGGYYGQDSWNNGNRIYPVYGVEAKFTPGFLDGRMDFEAFYGIYDQGALRLAKFIGVGVDYAINDRMSVGASYLRGAWFDFANPNDQYDVLEVEGAYSFANGLFATASYTNTIYPRAAGEDASFGIAVGFNFGNGVTFERRGYSGLYPGD